MCTGLLIADVRAWRRSLFLHNASLKNIRSRLSAGRTDSDV